MIYALKIEELLAVIDKLKHAFVTSF